MKAEPAAISPGSTFFLRSYLPLQQKHPDTIGSAFPDFTASLAQQQLPISLTQGVGK